MLDRLIVSEGVVKLMLIKIVVRLFFLGGGLARNFFLRGGLAALENLSIFA